MRRTMDILPEVETIRVEANGITFEVDTMGEGDRLVLCLHGFPEHSVSWRFQMPSSRNWDTGYGRPICAGMGILMRRKG